MLCKLKQTVLSLGQELTPTEIRIGRETPSWVVETGMPPFDAVAKLFLFFANQTFGLATGRFDTATKPLPEAFSGLAGWRIGQNDSVAERTERRKTCRKGR